MRTQLASIPSLERFAPLVEAALAADEAFYAGDYAEALEQAITVRELGGLPHNGTFLYLRSLLEAGEPAVLLRQARRINFEAPRPFGADPSPVYNRYGWYFEARAHELLGDPASAIEMYDRLLEGEWAEAVRRFPVIADAPERRAALSSGP